MSPSKKRLKKYTPFMYIISLSLFAGLIAWNSIELPFSNPWGVTGNLTVMEYNPASEFLRYGVFLLLPLIPLIVMYILNIRGSNRFYFAQRPAAPLETLRLPFWQKILYPGLFLAYTLVYALGLPTYHSHGALDTFHEGESMGFAISYMEGLIPYQDYIFVHGTIQDPLRSVIAFRLFGQSIGAVRTLESMVAVTVILLITLFVLKNFRYRPLPSLITISVVFSLLIKGFVDINQVLFIPITVPPRDITTLLFLLTILFLHQHLQRDEQNLHKTRFSATVFIFSFLPLATFAYSIDRAFYITAAYLILFIPVYLTVRKISKSLVRQYLIAALSGIAGGIIFFGIIIRGAFVSFVDFAILTMPKYKELMDGFVFPIYDLKFLFAVVLIALNVFWMMYKILQEMHLSGNQPVFAIVSLTRKYLPELALLLLSVFFFRSALGRSDWEHVSYSLLPVYLLTLSVLLKYYLAPVIIGLEKSKTTHWVLIGLLGLFLVWQGFSNLNHQTISEKFPLQTSDQELIPDNYKSAIHFLRQNLDDDAYFMTLTSEAMWYYFVEKPSPTRFPVVWFAMPYFYQEEMIEDLENKNVKYILYHNHHWANAIDGFTNQEKLPLLMAYIHEHYRHYYSFSDQEIWVRK